MRSFGPIRAIRAIAVSVVLLASSSCVGPEQPPRIQSTHIDAARKELAAEICLLGDDDVSVRDGAILQLRRSGVLALPAITEAMVGVSDPEVKARLETAFRLITGDQAQSLYKEGNLNEALLKFAEANGAEHPAAYVAERVGRTKLEILKLVPDPSTPRGQCANARDTADLIIRRSDGPWL